MRRILLAGIGLLMSGTARADVAVIDFSSIAQEIKSFTLQVQQEAIETRQLIGDELSWVTQGQQYAMQGRQYITEATQLAAFVHAPSVGAAMGLMNQVGLGNSLPVNPMAAMSLVRGVSYRGGGTPGFGGISQVLGSLSSLSYATNHVYTPDDGSFASKELIAKGNGINGTQGAALAAYGDLHNHQATQQALRDRLATATTPKDVQDIQAQIELENVWTANQQASMSALQVSAEAQRAADEQRGNESIRKSFDTTLDEARATGNF